MGCARPVPAVTCVAGSWPTGCGAHGTARGPLSPPGRSQVRGRTGGAATREPSLMPRHSLPGWGGVPGCQGPAAERRQAAEPSPRAWLRHREHRWTVFDQALSDILYLSGVAPDAHSKRGATRLILVALCQAPFSVNTLSGSVVPSVERRTPPDSYREHCECAECCSSGSAGQLLRAAGLHP